jgi:uncharacterized membrane protein YqaE (UPF0057 family)
MRAKKKPPQAGERSRGVTGAITVVLAVFMPPLAVYLQRGPGLTLALNIGLTVLGIPMGIFHAFWVLSRARREPNWGEPRSADNDEVSEGAR